MGKIKFASSALIAWMLAACIAHGNVLISELLVDNENGIRDEDGDREDWIELYNTGNDTVSLEGWWLTDKASNKTQWRFPAVTLPAQQTLLVWASSKNRTDPRKPLHTSFNLSKSGEYLGLYRPDPATGNPVPVDEYAPSFPALPSDISYGHSFGTLILPVEPPLVSYGSAARYRVLKSTEGAAFYSGINYAAGHVGHNKDGGWNMTAAFNDSAWTEVQTPVGWDTGYFTFGSNGNIKAAMYNINPSMLLRKKFTVDDPFAVEGLALKVRYEDGFVAFINGVEVLRANFKASSLAWNSVSATYFGTLQTPPETNITITALGDLLVEGENVLAIQGLNQATGSSDFFLDAELSAIDIEQTLVSGYFATPTPGALNGASAPGALLFDATPADPNVPRPLGNTNSPPMTVTVRVISTRNPVASVKVYYRTMWGTETNLTMLDSGLAPDAVAGDGIYSANLPTTTPTAGQMFRWRFEASDSAGTITKLPAYYSTASDSAQYFGTVAHNPTNDTSHLPVLEWFVQNSPANGPTTASFIGSCYFMSNFYDNVGQSVHGQTTKSFPKKSYNFDFTQEKRFLWRDGERRVKDIYLLTDYADKTKTRNTFSHWVGQLAGTPHHFAFPVRVQLNGAFHGVMDMMEKGGDRMLERNGLDPDGALYKIYNTVFTSGAEKKTRKTENNDDLKALYNNMLKSKALALRQTYTYDNMDVAAWINYLAVRFFNSDTDHAYKNFYLYRDTNVSGEWQPIIWDVDLSQGHIYVGGYFNDTLYVDKQFSTLFTDENNSVVYTIFYNVPEFQQMFVRRFRTLMDTLLQPPGTTNGLFETRMREIVATVDPDPAVSSWTDGDLDAVKWTIPFTLKNRPREEVERVATNYFSLRRTFLYGTNTTTRPKFSGVPIPNLTQTNTLGMVVVDSLDFLPASGTQAEEYVIFRNTTTNAVDISGWTVSGEIEHTFKGGTVIPAGAGTAATNYVGLLHLAKDVTAFRKRASGPTSGQRRFIQGNYKGQLSARGGTVKLHDQNGLLITTFTYTGAPTPAQQQLRITELQYHPADPTAAEAAALLSVKADDFEYIELLNDSDQPLTLTGAYFSDGIEFTFPATVLAPHQRIIVAKSPAAFAVRYPNVTIPVVGPYSGALDNAGETIAMKDAVGETIFSFEYKDGWYPSTDGSGRSLVLRDLANPLDKATSWGISRDALGSPGTGKAQFAQAYYGWDNFHFTSAERDDPLISGPFADADGDGIANWIEYALGTDPRSPNAMAPVSFSFASNSDAQPPCASLIFDRAVNAIDVQYDIIATGDLQWEIWSRVESTVQRSASLDSERETVSLRETRPIQAPRRFFKLRTTYTP